MAVVINEFEVVVEPAAPKDQGAAAPAKAASSEGLSPHDIARLNAHRAARLARVRAD